LFLTSLSLKVVASKTSFNFLLIYLKEGIGHLHSEHLYFNLNALSIHGEQNKLSHYEQSFGL
jgi:hypothetical protein